LGEGFPGSRSPPFHEMLKKARGKKLEPEGKARPGESITLGERVFPLNRVRHAAHQMLERAFDHLSADRVFVKSTREKEALRGKKKPGRSTLRHSSKIIRPMENAAEVGKGDGGCEFPRGKARDARDWLLVDTRRG